jgi:hypothetical protein
MGLLTNSYFYKKFDRSRARVLFRQSLPMLGSLGDQRLLLQTDGAASRRPTGERGARPKLPHKSKSLINHLKSMRSNPLTGSSRMISLVDKAAAQRVAAFCAEPLPW